MDIENQLLTLFWFVISYKNTVHFAIACKHADYSALSLNFDVLQCYCYRCACR